MTTMNEERSGYMPIPTAEQVAEALANVRCFHDMSAELIAPELLKNLLAAAPAGCKVVPVESLRRWVTGLQLGIISQRSVVEELRAILEAKDE